MSVVVETSVGDLVIDLYVDERPNCCKNFLKLCKIKYYNFCLFHNIQQNYIAQTGDPTGTGRGGESIFSFAYGDQARYFELESFPIIKHRKRGTVSMINNGADMHGSQFLITLVDNLDYLDGKHTVFGEVVKGIEVLDRLNEWVCDKEGRPYQDIRITHTVILDDPYDDFKALKEMNERASPEPTDERLKSDRIRVDEELDLLEGLSQEEIDKFMREREAKTRAKLLEIIGDIPDAEMKPPENVLFVCKLNPITTDEDLELIFSRFGKINSCEVIRDRKTGDSLCYAFIEFDTPEACENAYFKMDNVLIDDRRIHVDFSQSLAKFTWKGKGTGTGYLENGKDYRDEHTKKASKYDNESIKQSEFRMTSKSRVSEGYELIIEEDNYKNQKYEPIKKDNRHHYHHEKSAHNDQRKDSKRDHRERRSKSRDRYRSERSGDRSYYRHRSKERATSRDRDKDRDRKSKDHRKYEDEKRHYKHKY